MNTVSPDERRWRAESDARTLAEAKVIANDVQRLRAAQEAAQRMAEEQAKEARAMRSVAGSKNNAPARASGPKQKKNPTSTFNVMERI